MGIPDRLYHIAKSYIDSAKTRWDEVDEASRKELDDAVASPALSAFERAQAKINNTQSANSAARELYPSTTGVPPTGQAFDASADPPPSMLQPSTNALAAAYKVLDVPQGSSLAIVQQAHQDLQKKADPSRFAAGSKDRKLAEDILRRVNAAYMLLANSLCAPSDDRFDRLEF